MPDPTAPVEVEVYPRKDGKYDWRRVARRGNLPDEIVADSAGQGYETRDGARDAAKRENPDMPIIDLEATPEDA